MNFKEIENKQVALQKEAKALLEKMQVINLLSEYGEVTIVGSLATGLMTWPDIDIEVTTDKLPSRDEVGKLATQLFTHPENERMVLLDNTQGFNMHYKSGVHVMFEQRKWKVDIWFFLPTEKMTGREYMVWLNDNMTEEKRKAILFIKEQVASHPKYRKEIFSTDIYEAVIKKEIKDLDGFREYLRETNRVLD